MKKSIIIIVFTISLQLSYSQISFEKTFGGGYFDFGRYVEHTFDGGYIITGGIGYGDGYDACLLKTNEYGDSLWIQLFPGYTQVVRQTVDSGYILAGCTLNNFICEDILVIKIDQFGDILWSQTYGGEGDDRAIDILQTDDGCFMLLCSTIGGGENDYLIKINENGDSLWTQHFQRNGSSFSKTDDGGFIIGGSYAGAPGNNCAYFIKIDSLGGVIWEKIIGLPESTVVSVEQTNDGGYIGIIMSPAIQGSVHTYLYKLNTEGEYLWSNVFDFEPNIGYKVEQTNDNGFIIGGTTNPSYSSLQDVYLLKADSNGDVCWINTYGGEYRDGGFSIDQTSDGGYIIVGSTNSMGYGESDIYLIKTDEGGMVTLINGREQFPNNNLLVSPNPFSVEAMITFDLYESTEILLVIYNQLGQRVSSLLKKTGEKGNQIIKWNAEDMPSGIYFIKLQTDKGIITQKIIKR